MPDVTEVAQAYIEERLANAGASPEQALRLEVENGQWLVEIDHRRPEDVTIEDDGNVLLVVDEALAAELTDKVVDVVATDAGPALAVVP